MAFSPTSFLSVNYRDFKNYWLKAYEPGTTTPKVMALESDGGTQVAKLELNKDGFLESAGGALVIPYIDGNYDAWLFPTEAEADADETANALQVADDITGASQEGISGDLINDLSQAYIFATVSDYANFVTAFPVGKIINLLDRGAEFEVIDGTGTVNSFDIIGSGAVAQSIQLIDDTGNVLKYGAVNDLFVSDNFGPIEAAANKTGKVHLPVNVKIRTTSMPTTAALRSITGESHSDSILQFDFSSLTSVYEDGLVIDNIKLDSLQQIAWKVTSNRLKMTRTWIQHSGSTIVLGRYNPISIEDSALVQIIGTIWFNCGYRMLDCLDYVFDAFYIDVNRVGEGPTGTTDGTDGVKCSRCEGVISNGQILNSSRDVIDIFEGGRRNTISNIYGENSYFNGIEIKMQGAQFPSPPESVRPTEINIDNVTLVDCCEGNNSPLAGIFIDGSSSVVTYDEAPHNINISNFNCLNFGINAKSAAVPVGIRLTDVAGVNITNSTIDNVIKGISVGGYGMQMSRARRVRISNSAIHGEQRSFTMNECTDVKISNCNIGFSESTQSSGNIAMIISGLNNNNLQFINTNFLGTDPTVVDGTSSGGSGISFSHCTVNGTTRIDVFDKLSFDHCDLSPKVNNVDGFFKSTDASTDLSFIGGTITGARFGISDQGTTRVKVQGVTFIDCANVPISGATVSNRLVTGNISQLSGAFPTAGAGDVIDNNIEIA